MALAFKPRLDERAASNVRRLELSGSEPAPAGFAAARRLPLRRGFNR